MSLWDGINRRRCVRAQFPYTIHIYSIQGKPISTYTEDISLGGVKVVTQQALEPASFVDLKIYIRDEFVRCKGKIMWVKEKQSPVLDGIKFYESGIEFSGLTLDEEKIVTECVALLEKKRKEKGKVK